MTDIENRLVPVLRDGVNLIKMVILPKIPLLTG